MANGRADRAMLVMDGDSDGRRRLGNADADALDATGAALVDSWGLPSSVVEGIAKAVDAALNNATAARASRGSPPRYAAEYVALIDAVRRAWLKRALGAGHSGTGRTFDEG